MRQNVSLQCNGVDRMRSLCKIPTRLRGTNFCTTSARFAPSFVRRSRMHTNSTKCTKTFRFQWVGSGAFVAKSSTRLRGTNFYISSARFAPSFVRQPNGPKCTQIVQNVPKRQFMVQCGGLGVFVAKKSNATSGHELLH